MRDLRNPSKMRTFHNAVSAMRDTHDPEATRRLRQDNLPERRAMPVDRAASLDTFRGQYGRLCTLVARALAQGHIKAHVIQSALGKGDLLAPVYIQLRRQYDRSNRALWECKQAGATGEDLVKVAQDCRLVVGEEWHLEIPRFA